MNRVRKRSRRRHETLINRLLDRRPPARGRWRGRCWLDGQETGRGLMGKGKGIPGSRERDVFDDENYFMAGITIRRITAMRPRG